MPALHQGAGSPDALQVLSYYPIVDRPLIIAWLALFRLSLVIVKAKLVQHVVPHSYLQVPSCLL